MELAIITGRTPIRSTSWPIVMKLKSPPIEPKLKKVPKVPLLKCKFC